MSKRRKHRGGSTSCQTTRATRIVMVGGRSELTISKNADGTLRFKFANP